MSFEQDSVVSTSEHLLDSETIRQSIPIAEGLRLEIHTATRADQTLISMGLYHEDQPAEPITTPSVVMANGRDAEIDIGLDAVERLRLTFRYPNTVDNQTP